MKKLLVTVICSAFYFEIISYIESNLIAPLVLNKDYCYYHSHETPFLIELFYMSPASNSHPEGSFFKSFVILLISITLGYFSGKIIFNKFNRKI